MDEESGVQVAADHRGSESVIDNDLTRLFLQLLQVSDPC